jgi:hypothetical protein
MVVIARRRSRRGNPVVLWCRSQGRRDCFATLAMTEVVTLAMTNIAALAMLKIAALAMLKIVALAVLIGLCAGHFDRLGVALRIGLERNGELLAGTANGNDVEIGKARGDFRRF